MHVLSLVRGLVGLGALVVVSSAMSASSSSGSRTATTVQASCGVCGLLGCSFGGHSFIETGSSLFGATHSCFLSSQGLCPHGACGLGVNERAVVDSAVAALVVAKADLNSGGRRAAAAVSRLLASYPGRVSLNRARESLQVSAACNTAIVSINVPLDAEVLALIDEPRGPHVGGR